MEETQSESEVKGRTQVDRVALAEARAQRAKNLAHAATLRVNRLRRDISRTDRRRRAHSLIQMGAELQALGVADASEVGRLIATLKTWMFTDKVTGEKRSILTDAVAKVVASRKVPPPAAS